MLFLTAYMYLPPDITSTCHQSHMSKKRVSFISTMCIKKIPKGFHVIIGASNGGQVSSQINVAFPLSQSTLRVRRNACGRGFRDSVKVKAAMEMNTFTSETTYMINTSSGHCADNDVNDNPPHQCERTWLTGTV